ncbi:hypothetical protein AYL99_02384 [Fonsecaea erecta]|uniref:Uncharacterized protein n=1 Tax=Fonsecaea erecta TaxID=1367422 RepID=A0A178ZTQ4_9EURO|nr:hypothetical protein AYL99_02384 [Fonsecaea erecta]OAP63157.1 hypothetical protein AYL99_02384 [Fonsecaea erecta]
MADRILKGAVKGIASGIGLVSEGIHHHKERKEAKTHAREATGQEKHPEAAPGGSFEEGDEEHWDLDEAQDELISTCSETPETSHPEEHTSQRDQANPTKITNAFMRRHPLPASAPSHTSTEHGPDGKGSQTAVAEFQTAPRIPLPVILPQRRPEARARGFIRAYAPDLAVKGIDQETFLDFIETFNQASLASPWLDAINLAGFATLALPPGISQAVQLAITISVTIAKDIQSRKRQNTFLDRINDEFFRPRGLYCLVMTWQPDTPTLHTSVDVTRTVAARMATPESTGAKVKRAMKTSAGASGVEFAECAPLVFPELDELAVQTGAEAECKRDTLKHYKSFAEVYFDRRAQAKHAGENPDSALAKLGGPKPHFTSRYADPNHPASNGNLISLLTGGKVSPPDLREVVGGGRGSGGGIGGFGGRRGGPGMGMGTGMGIIGGHRSGGMGERGGMALGGFGGGRLGGGWRGRMGYGQDQDQEYMMQRQQQDLQYRDPYQQQPDRPGGGIGLGMGRGAGGSPAGLEGLVGAIMGSGLGGGRGQGQSPIKRILSQDVLYLVIVNMPTEEELAAAHEMSEREHEHA